MSYSIHQERREVVLIGQWIKCYQGKKDRKLCTQKRDNNKKDISAGWKGQRIEIDGKIYILGLICNNEQYLHLGLEGSKVGAFLGHWHVVEVTFLLGQQLEPAGNGGLDQFRNSER
jgi:hypothetical protein